MTKLDLYLISYILNFSAYLIGAMVFSKLNLVGVYRQIPFTKDMPTTTVISAFRSFDFLRMSFGRKNAAQTFQQLLAGNLVSCRAHKIHWKKISNALLKNWLMALLRISKFTLKEYFCVVVVICCFIL